MASAGMTGIEQLDRLIATAKGIGTGPEYAQAAARSTETWLRTTLAAGIDPNTGASWPATEEGQRPLKTASGQPTIRLAGQTIIIALKGRYVFQHFGVRGHPGRRVIPQGAMPDRLGMAIRAGLVEPFRQKSRGK